MPSVAGRKPAGIPNYRGKIKSLLMGEIKGLEPLILSTSVKFLNRTRLFEVNTSL